MVYFVFEYFHPDTWDIGRLQKLENTRLFLSFNAFSQSRNNLCVWLTDISFIDIS